MGSLFTASPRVRAAKAQRDADQAALDASRLRESPYQDIASPIADKRSDDAVEASAEASQLRQQDRLARSG